MVGELSSFHFILALATLDCPLLSLLSSLIRRERDSSRVTHLHFFSPLPFPPSAFFFPEQESSSSSPHLSSQSPPKTENHPMHVISLCSSWRGRSIFASGSRMQGHLGDLKRSSGGGCSLRPEEVRPVHGRRGVEVVACCMATTWWCTAGAVHACSGRRGKRERERESRGVVLGGAAHVGGLRLREAVGLGDTGTAEAQAPSQGGLRRGRGIEVAQDPARWWRSGG